MSNQFTNAQQQQQRDQQIQQGLGAQQQQVQQPQQQSLFSFNAAQQPQIQQSNAYQQQQQDPFSQQQQLPYQQPQQDLFGQQQYNPFQQQQQIPTQARPQPIPQFQANNIQQQQQQVPQQGIIGQMKNFVGNLFGNSQPPVQQQQQQYGQPSLFGAPQNYDPQQFPGQNLNDDEFIEPVKLTGEAAKLAYDLNTQITFKLAAMYKMGKLRKDQVQFLPGIVSLQAADQSDTKEGPKVGLDLICVIDKSGSMQGQKLEMVKKTILLLLDFLGPNDRLCLIEFQSSARRLTSLKKVTPENRQYFLNVVNSLQADGGTTIASGTSIAFEQLKQRRYVNNVASIFLLSDGQDGSAEQAVKNQLTNYEQVFTMHSFGFGQDHDAKLMTKLCNLKNGSFYFVNDITLLDEFFVDALGGLVSVIADQIRISVRSNPNDPFQEIKVSKVYGNMWKTLTPNRDFQITLPQLAVGSRKDYVFELSLPKFEGELGDHQRQASVIQARLELRSTQSQEVIHKEAELQLTFFNENEPNPVNEQDFDVATQYYRVKGADVIDDARKACEQNQFPQAQTMIDNLIANIQKNPKVAEKTQTTLQDLQQAKQASQPQQFQQFGSKQMAQMTSNNYAQQGVNALFSAQGMQMQQPQQAAYQNKQQTSYMQQVQHSKMSR